MARIPKVTHVLIADEIRTDTTRKAIIIGVYDGTVVINQIPGAMASFALRVEFDPGDQKQGKFELEILGPNRKPVAAGGGEWGLGEGYDRAGPAVLLINGRLLPVPEAGKYTIKIGINGRKRKASTFRVRLAAPGDPIFVGPGNPVAKTEKPKTRKKKANTGSIVRVRNRSRKR
jgi:hypothetical protein